MTIPLSLTDQEYLVRMFEGYPLAVRADMHRYVQDYLRPIPRVGPDDVRRAADAALTRYGDRRAA